jgi:uncharacterized OB-fold protein
MSTPARPLPRDVAPDRLDDPIWEACRRHELLVNRCTVCGRCYWPATCCVEHGGDPMEWVVASGRGTVHTYTVYHHTYSAAFADRIPYVVAIVMLEEGCFLHCDVIDCDPADVHVGMAVEVTFEDVDEETTLPHFRPATN